ncbi:unnamed protein product [Ixodes persulcatus]
MRGNTRSDGDVRQPRGPPGGAGAGPLVVPRVPLLDGVPVEPGVAPTGAHRGAAVPLPLLPQGLWAREHAAEARARAHGREALPVPLLPSPLHPEGAPADTPAPARLQTEGSPR